MASQPLVNGEQFSGGGLGSARGYLEGTSLGDNGVFGTVEFRSPSLIGIEDEDGNRDDEWRFHAFVDAGILGIYDALPGQQRRNGFASLGAGTRIKMKKHYNASVDLGIPFIDQTDTEAGKPRITFVGWADF